jgi:hypothetical protein
MSGRVKNGIKSTPLLPCSSNGAQGALPSGPIITDAEVEVIARRFMDTCDDHIRDLCGQYGITPQQVLFRLMNDPYCNPKLRIDCAKFLGSQMENAAKEEAPAQRVVIIALPDNGRRIVQQ